MDLTNLSSNWKKLQATLNQADASENTSESRGLKRKRDSPESRNQRVDRTHAARKKTTRGGISVANRNETSTFRAKSSNSMDAETEKATSAPVTVNAGLTSRSGHVWNRLSNADPRSIEVGRYVAVDCEMVGVGPKPDSESALARVSIVNYDGDQVYDSYVKPLEEVTDWRTHVSGILPKHMTHARNLEQVQQDVCSILQDRILIGHAVRHDLDALLISHPKKDIRDTARHPAYRKIAGGSSPRLKILASELLGLNIQVGEHSSVEDARACMMLFRRDKPAFEREHAKRWPTPRSQPSATNEAEDSAPKKSKKKKKKR